MSLVSLVGCKSYDSPELEASVRRSVDLVGGMGAYVRAGNRVLIKPNMLSAHAPHRRINTDPAVVEAVAKMVIEAGGRPMIADSPALDRFRRVAAKSGIQETAEKLGIEVFELTTPTRVDVPEGSAFKSLELASQAIEADVVINLPKLKTHSQMLLTLGVKNLFGTVVAQRKAEWHAMIGMNRDTFAALLLDIYLTVGPALTVLDGVWGMEGQGPANGKARHIGLIAASPDAPALDLTVCRLLGVQPRRFPLYRAAVERKLVRPDLEDIQLTGDPLSDLAITGFNLPELEGILPLPGILGKLAAKHLVSKPVQIPGDCIACEKCIDICASKAITLKKKRLTFNYDRCIRCFCCQEVCPQNAIRFRKGPIVRLLNKLGR